MAHLLSEYDPPPAQAAYTARLRSILARGLWQRARASGQPDQLRRLVEPLSRRNAS